MLVIIVGGIPIAMPTVLSVTLALGAAKLAQEGAIVARMSAVEELAGMDILCSDKTGEWIFDSFQVSEMPLNQLPFSNMGTNTYPLNAGTLTLNKLSVDSSSVYPTDKYPIIEIMKYAALSANTITEEPIDVVLHESYPHPEVLKGFKTTKFVPFNPNDKFTCATVVEEATGKVVRLLKGSPQVRPRHLYEDALCYQ